MCDQYDNRGCEVVDELTLVITNLEMTIADLKKEVVEDLKILLDNDWYDFNMDEITDLIKKWEVK